MSKTAKPPAPAPPETEAKPANGLVRLLIVLAFIFVVVAAECLAAYFLLPSASEVAGAAEEKLAKKDQSDTKHEPEEIAEPEETPTTEVDLGVYNISSHQPAAGTTLRIDFKLVGTVNVADKKAFDELLENNKNRLRDRIIFEIRNAEVADLSDPGLGLIKRRILERVNALLGRPLLRGVVFSDFSFAGA